LSFSPDGVFLIEGTEDNVIRLWKVKDNGQLIDFKHFAPNNSGVDSLEISPDGKTLAVSNGNGVYLWDIASGRLICRLTNRTAKFRELSWSIDNLTLAVSSNMGIEVWDAISWRQIENFEILKGRLINLSWSPLGKYLAVSRDGRRIQLFDVYNESMSHTFISYSDVQSLKFSPDGKKIAAGLSSDRVEIWDISGNLLATLHGAISSGNLYVDFSNNENLLVSNISVRNSEEGIYAVDNLQIWRTDEWQPINSWKIGNQYVIQDLDLSADDQTIAIARTDPENFRWENAIEIWDLTSNENIHTIKGTKSAPLSVWSLSFSPDGKTLAALSRESVGYFYEGQMREIVTLWDVEQGELIWRSEDLGVENRKGLPGYYPDAIDWSNDGKLIAIGTSDGLIKFLNSENGKMINTLQGHTMWVTGVQFSPNGNLIASVSLDGTIRIWGIK